VLRTSHPGAGSTHDRDVTLFHELGTSLVQDVFVLPVLDQEMAESTSIDENPHTPLMARLAP
jgi:hypothetical protein